MGALFEIKTNDNNHLEITVTGYPAKYVNFRKATLEDVAIAKESAAIQILDLESDIISHSSLKVHLQKKQRERKAQGWVNTFDFSFNPSFNANINNFEYSYILSYGINKYLYAGFGIGVILDIQSSEFSDNFSIYNQPERLPINLINIPIYGHVRVYLLPNRVICPFVSASIGARLSTKRTATVEIERYNSNDIEIDYSTSGLYFNPAIGLKFKTGDRTDMYISAGRKTGSYPTYINLNNYGTEHSINKEILSGWSFSLGFTF